MASDRAEQAVNAWNAEYLDALYERWQADPEDVDPQWREFFKGFDLGVRRMQPAEAPGGPAPGAADLARQELAERERFGLPPVSRMARIVIRDADLSRCRATAQHLADELRRLAEPGVRIRGAAPCPIARIAGKHRQQIELLAATATALQRLLTTARRRALIRPGTAMAIDVDPIDLV